MFLLQSSRYNPFESYRIIDYFKRVEFQQKDSFHVLILLWLENDPKETVSKEMPDTIHLIDLLCCINPERIERKQYQTHKHTITCYKRAKDEENKKY